MASATKKKTPLFRKWWFILIVAVIALFVVAAYYSEQEARGLGFENYTEMMDAEEFGITDPAEWRANKDKLIAEREANEAIERERQAAEEAAMQAELDAAKAELETLKREAEEERNRPKELGETFQVGDFSVAVFSIEKRRSVGSWPVEEVAAGGAVFVAVRYDYISNASGPIGSFRAPSVSLVDPNGNDYSMNLGATSSYSTELNLTSNAFSDISPGIQYGDAVVFEVAESLLSNGRWQIVVKSGGESAKLDVPS